MVAGSPSIKEIFAHVPMASQVMVKNSPGVTCQSVFVNFAAVAGDEKSIRSVRMRSAILDSRDEGLVRRCIVPGTTESVTTKDGIAPPLLGKGLPWN